LPDAFIVSLSIAFSAVTLIFSFFSFFLFFYLAFIFVPASLLVCRRVHARACGAITALLRLSRTARGKN